MTVIQTESFETGLQNKSTNQIFKVRTCNSGFSRPQNWIPQDSGFANPYFFRDLFCAIVLKIREDLWGLVSFVKTGQIFWTLAGFGMYDSKQIFPSPDLWTTIRNKSRFTDRTFLESGFVTTIQSESMDLLKESTSTQFPDTNPATLIFCQTFGFQLEVHRFYPENVSSSGLTISRVSAPPPIFRPKVENVGRVLRSESPSEEYQENQVNLTV